MVRLEQHPRNTIVVVGSEVHRMMRFEQYVAEKNFSLLQLIREVPTRLLISSEPLVLLH